MRRAVFLLLLTGCAGRVYVQDVARGFRIDESELRHAVPSFDDIRALQYHAPTFPMARTARLAELFLEQNKSENVDRTYVEAMLACAYCAQNRPEEAYRLARYLSVPPLGAPEDHRTMIQRAIWIAPACRALAGRIALEEMIKTEQGQVEFVETYGDFVDYVLPRKHSRDYLLILERHVTDLLQVCFPPAPRAPRELERRMLRLNDMRRRLAEQTYNDSASLLQAQGIPEKDATPDAADRFFATATSALYISLAFMSDDLVPRQKMEPAQKQWLREQSLSTYETARAAAAAYIDRKEMPALEDGYVPEAHATREECLRRLYAQLYFAQQEVLAWITIR